MSKTFEKIEWLKAVLAFVLVFGLFVSYLYLSRQNTFQDNLWELLKQLIPEFMASLIVVLVIYFIFVRKGMSETEELIEQISQNLRNHFPSKGGFISPAELKAVFDLKKEIGNAQEIDLIGYSLVALISSYQQDIIQALKRGGKYRIIIIKPNSAASKLIDQNMTIKEMELDLVRVIQRLEQIQKEVASFPTKKAGKIEVKFMDWIPSCAIVRADDLMSIKFYALDVKTDHPKIITNMFLSSRVNPDMFEYFVQQFNLLWDQSESFEGK